MKRVIVTLESEGAAMELVALLRGVARGKRALAARLRNAAAERGADMATKLADDVERQLKERATLLDTRQELSPYGKLLFAAGLAAVDRMVEELRGSDYALRCGTAAVDELLIYREDIAGTILNTLAQEGVLKVEEEKA